MTQGWRTTEFWISATTIVATVLGAVSGMLPAEWAGTISAVVSGLYAFSRGMAKRGQSDAEIVDRVNRALDAREFERVSNTATPGAAERPNTYHGDRAV